MSSIIPTLTAAGIQAVFNASNTGLQAEITHIALGDSGYTPTDSATALVAEKQRVAVSGGEMIGANQIHLTASAIGTDEYWIREVGFFLSDGTLLAVYSHATNAIAHKSANLDILLSFDLLLSALPASSVTINGTGALSFPAATDNKQGIVRFATDDEATNRTNVDAAVKPHQLPSEITVPNATTTTKGLVEKATSQETTAGTVDKYPDAALLKQLLDSRFASSGMPTGSVLAFASTTTPNGFLVCNGATVDRTSYADLFAIIGTTFGSGNGSTTFGIPDLRGEFIRGVSSGRALGSAQSDAIQNIVGAVDASTSLFNTYGSGALYHEGINRGHREDTTNAYGGRIKFDASRVVRTANETRPQNIALNYIIKY